MSDGDLAEELGCTVEYVKRVRRQAAREAAAKEPKEAVQASEKPQLALNFAAPRVVPNRHLSREKVLLAMGYKKNTEAYFVAWLVLRYGGIREAQIGLQEIANHLNTLPGVVLALGRVAA
jgi:hypothetical protein